MQTLTKMYFDRFDICEAYYIFFAENHEGMGDPLYYRLSCLLRYFKPRPRISRDNLSENAQVILERLEAEYCY